MAIRVLCVHNLIIYIIHTAYCSKKTIQSNLHRRSHYDTRYSIQYMHTTYCLHANNPATAETAYSVQGRGGSPKNFYTAGWGSRFFSYPKHPYHLWGPPSFLCNGNRGLLSPKVTRMGRQLTSNPFPMRRLRISGGIIQSSLCFHGVLKGNFTLLSQTITLDTKHFSDLPKNTRIISIL